MLTQNNIILQHNQNSKKATVASTRNLLRNIYNASTVEATYFWGQNSNGVPVDMIKYIDTDGTEVPISVLKENAFDASRWAGTRKPAYYVGTWPPNSIHDLLGTPAKEEECASCRAIMERCGCDYPTWADEMQDFFVDKIRISSTPGKGHGLFSRAKIPQGTALGEYTGELVPKALYMSMPDDETQYVADIDIGKWKCVGGKLTTRRPSCGIDARYRGSFLRFLNHSCDANSRLAVVRVGMGARVLITESLRSIDKGEEITIDYGSEYIRPGESCLCGSKTCRYRRIEKVDDVGMDDAESEHTKETANEGDDSDVSMHSDHSDDDSGSEYGHGNGRVCRGFLI